MWYSHPLPKFINDHLSINDNLLDQHTLYCQSMTMVEEADHVHWGLCHVQNLSLLQTLANLFTDVCLHHVAKSLIYCLVATSEELWMCFLHAVFYLLLTDKAKWLGFITVTHRSEDCTLYLYLQYLCGHSVTQNPWYSGYLDFLVRFNMTIYYYNMYSLLQLLQLILTKWKKGEGQGAAVPAPTCLFMLVYTHLAALLPICCAHCCSSVLVPGLCLVSLHALHPLVYVYIKYTISS
jgi:hypothetical protein